MQSGRQMVLTAERSTKHKWTDEEREIVRRDYKGTMASAIAIARCLSYLTGSEVTKYAVKGQVQRLGIAKQLDRRPWTPEEDERLGELITRCAPAKVAKLMGRSENAVVVRSKRLGYSRRVRDGWYTAKDVSEILGVDHKWVVKRIELGVLRATYHFPNCSPKKNGSHCWHIKEADLTQFIRRYPQELTGRNVDLIVVVELLAGLKN